MATSSETRVAAADHKTLTLKSSDGEEFILSESAAVRSETIRNIVEEGCTADVIPLLKVEARDLSKIILYLKKHDDDALSRNDLNNFDQEFLSDESVEDLLHCVLAANYLIVGDLIDLLVVKIANLIKDYSVDRIRKLFDIQNDFEPAEEEKIREENAWTFEDVRDP